ncbi:multidrug ABC transporter permease [Betaproteobacteria bacterium GR16-43]|nr:multidrug ABC transporter permease [Betaproteobacteria bacterium GR16-43]
MLPNVPVSYVFRNIWTRKLTTALTAGGMALVVFVFAAVLMLDAGLKKTAVSTGSAENAILLRQSAQTEIQSGVSRDQASLIETLPGVARGNGGEPQVTKETVVLTAQNKRGTTKPANLVVRGMPQLGLAIRPQVKIVDGRLFKPGSSEIVVGLGVVNAFDGVAIGQSLRFAGREWTIVGHFDAKKSGYDSEVWGDVEQMMQAFRRTAYSSVIAHLEDAGRFETFKAAIAADQRLALDVKQEPAFYEEQTKALSGFLFWLGLALSIIFSVGAMIGAMITMYASVANRTREIGTLRALGFRRRSILVAFLLESMLLALLGGLVGLFFASFLQVFTITTMNFTAFSQLAFGFDLTARIVLNTLIFAAVMGFVGGFLPSVQASRLEIVDSLRAA